MGLELTFTPDDIKITKRQKNIHFSHYIFEWGFNLLQSVFPTHYIWVGLELTFTQDDIKIAKRQNHICTSVATELLIPLE